MTGRNSLLNAFIIQLVLFCGSQCTAQTKRWSLNDEVYACGASGMTFEDLAGAGVTLLSHAPWGGHGMTIEQAEAFFKEAHRCGIKVIPYVSLYKVIDSRQVEDTYHTKQHPFWRELDLVEHPQWALIDEHGNIRRPFDAPGYRAGVHQSCTNVAGLADAYERGIRNVMALGADGVFVDNVHPHPVCFGPKFGKHEHLYPDKDNLHTYHLALKQVYEVVKEYGHDKVVMLNTGSGPGPPYTDCGDGIMLESYICTIAPEAHRRRWHDWKTIMQWPRQFQDYMSAGKAVVALSYLGHTVNPVKDDAFYCAACGKMSGFLWTANIWLGSWTTRGADQPGNDILRLLHRARLGRARGAITEEKGVAYRLFDRGIAAVNPGPMGKEVKLPVPAGAKEMCDLYPGIVLPVTGGAISAIIPPESGRLYVAPDAAFVSFMQECVLAVKGVAHRLNQLRTQPELKDWSVCDSRHQGGQGRVGIDETEYHSGGASLRVTSEGKGGKVWAHSLGMVFLQQAPEPVTVSYWAKAAPDGRAAARLLFDVDFQGGGNDWWSPPEVTGHEWTRQEAIYKPAKPIHDLKLLCTASYDRPGTVWFDDLVVTSGKKDDNWVRNPGFEESEDIMTGDVKTTLQEWVDGTDPPLERLRARYERVPSPGDRGELLGELGSHQRSVTALLQEKVDGAIRLRLTNLREYAGRVLSLATGVTLTINAPRQAVPGQKLTVELVCGNGSQQVIDNVRFDLDVPQGWAAQPIPETRSRRLESKGTCSVRYEASVPSTAPTGVPVMLTATASFKWSDSPGSRQREVCIVQTHGLRVAESSSAAVRPVSLFPHIVQTTTTTGGGDNG